MKRTVAATAFVLAFASCGGDTAAVGEVIDRTTFIETYVDLRWSAVHSPDFRITPEAREEILASHGVTAEDLLRFADVHGRDLEYMNEVWTDVGILLDARQDEQQSEND